MKISNKLNPFKTNKDVKKLEKIFLKNGKKLFIAGGAVRDILLDKNPSDLDFATDATPDEMMQFYKHIIPTGIGHGTVTFQINDSLFEVTTFRKDVVCHGRNADVEFTKNLATDAQRRDFTINAMYIDSNGDVYDFFDGIEDLKNLDIRFVGDPLERIKEDQLRVLRYFRFLVKFGQSPSVDMLELLSQNADMREISGERIQAELSKFETIEQAMRFVDMIPNAILLQCGFKAKNEMYLMLPKEVSKSAINTVALLSGVLFTNKEDKDAFLEHIKSSNRCEYLSDLYFFLVKRFRENTHTEKELKKNIVRNPDVRLAYEHLTGAVYKWNPEVPFSVNGKDLIDLGMKEGIELGRTIGNLRESWINSDYTLTKEDLLRPFGYKQTKQTILTKILKFFRKN